MPAAEYPELRAPDAVYARARWIPQHKVDYAKEADAILREHGSVYGQRSYERRAAARWHSRKLIRLMVELRMYERDELSEHTNRGRDGRFMWAVEFAKPKE